MFYYHAKLTAAEKTHRNRLPEKKKQITDKQKTPFRGVVI